GGCRQHAVPGAGRSSRRAAVRGSSLVGGARLSVHVTHECCVLRSEHSRSSRPAGASKNRAVSKKSHFAHSASPRFPATVYGTERLPFPRSSLLGMRPRLELALKQVIRSGIVIQWAQVRGNPWSV